MNNHKKTHIIVGMSGGVDSAVAALVLKQQGYLVEGLFMKNWEDDGEESNCSASLDLIDAQQVAIKLGIKLHTVNFANEYWDRVFEYFLDEYKAGRTPNPDVMCNKEIKFKAFLDHAIELGADFIATGHYVRKQELNGKYQLLKGLDNNKDQSYFLYLLNQKQLAKSLFPVGELLKPEVRSLAEKHGFKNHAKKDSTGICFIGERKFKQFLSRYLPAKPGDIVTPEGKTIGKHDGLMYYTIGQRQGIGIGGRKDANEEPWYVAAKDLNKNILLVVQGQNHPQLYKNKLTANQPHWINGTPPQIPLQCTAKIRYRQTDQNCILEKLTDDMANITFDSPQRAIAPGQSIVFYRDEICLGGGIIC
jgi:tRNA-uridine 2-sulfurtransferase